MLIPDDFQTRQQTKSQPIANPPRRMNRFEGQVVAMIRFRLCSWARGTLGPTLAFALALALHARPAAAQQPFKYVGPSECVNCHDHESERQWYEKQEIPEILKRFPAKRENAGHINALKQLETPRSTEYARAIGLRDKYDANGACVRCHATVFQGDANAGVSCESCHGPASGYLKPHQTKGAYAQSISLGLVDIVGKIAAWAQQCASCHVMDDQRLVAAGHPSGDDFELGEKFGPVSLHFKKKYSVGDVSVISREMVRGIVARRRGGRAPLITPTGMPPAPAVTPSSSTPSAPAVTTPGPAPALTSLPSGPDTAAPPPISPPGAVAPTERLADAPPSRVTEPPPVALRTAGSTTAGTASSRAGAEAMPSVSAAVANVQGRLIEILTELLQRGAIVPVRTGTRPPALTPYTGPDAALLQLQRDAIALALEILGSPPPAKPPSR